MRQVQFVCSKEQPARQPPPNQPPSPSELTQRRKLAEELRKSLLDLARRRQEHGECVCHDVRVLRRVAQELNELNGRMASGL